MVTDLRDNRDPELLGLALLGLAAASRKNGLDSAAVDAAEAAGVTIVPVKLSLVADRAAAALAGVPNHGTPEAESMRPSTNGHAPEVRALPPVEERSDDCPVCKLPRASNGRWLVCLNETCERYEEPI